MRDIEKWEKEIESDKSKNGRDIEKWENETQSDKSKIEREGDNLNLGLSSEVISGLSSRLTYDQLRV